MKKKSKRRKRISKAVPAKSEAEKQSMSEFHAAFPQCWMCLFLETKQSSRTELHHIAGRGKRHHVRENYAALCQRHHMAIQSQMDAELICLALKERYDIDFYSPSTICDLRGKSVTWWTYGDVDRCRRVLNMMKACVE